MDIIDAQTLRVILGIVLAVLQITHTILSIRKESKEDA